MDPDELMTSETVSDFANVVIGPAQAGSSRCCRVN
jgi:hypothetical protein